MTDREERCSDYVARRYARVEKIYGHPGQIQPAHIVIISNHYRLGAAEIKTDKNPDRRNLNHYKDIPIEEIIKERDRGDSYYRIGKRHNLDPASVRFWYLQAKRG